MVTNTKLSLIKRLVKRLRKLSLRGRIILLALATLVTTLTLFSWLGVQSVGQSIETTLGERLVLARVLAGRLDQTLTYILVQLEGIAASESSLPDTERFTSAADSVRLVLANSGIYIRDIFLIDRDGMVTGVVPDNPASIGLDMLVVPEVRHTAVTGQPSISGLVSGGFSGVPTVLISVPFLDNESRVVGAIVCSLDIEQISTGSFGQDMELGQTGYIEIVDGNGIVLARTKPGYPPRAFEGSDHPVRFAELISEGKATVGTCHRCHETGSNVEIGKDMLAFAPLSTASWGVVIRQAEEEAFFPTSQLEMRFLILGIILVGCTLLLLWAMMRGILNPIKSLTLAAKKVAANDFEAEIPLRRNDEIGELSAAFDNMRQEIARSRDEILHHYQAAKEKGELRGHLLGNVIGAQEEERKRIARELHDEYGQTLTGLIMNIESLEDMTDPGQIKFRKKLENTKNILVETLGAMRKLTLDLRPSSLDDLGLVAGIRAHIKNRLSDEGIQVNFHHSGSSKRLSPPLEIAVFRIIQEALHNVIKHAQATSVDIDLKIEDGRIIVQVEDNGRGFEVATVFRFKIGTQSLGILGMQERTEILNGKFSVESRIGQGTRLRVEIPLDGAPPSDGDTGKGVRDAGIDSG